MKTIYYSQEARESHLSKLDELRKKKFSDMNHIDQMQITKYLTELMNIIEQEIKKYDL